LLHHGVLFLDEFMYRPAPWPDLPPLLATGSPSSPRPAPLLEDAADAGSRHSGSGLAAGRAKAITDHDPTGSMALDPRRSQIGRA
jgi:hypothetical protein